MNNVTYVSPIDHIVDTVMEHNPIGITRAVARQAVGKMRAGDSLYLYVGNSTKKGQEGKLFVASTPSQNRVLWGKMKASDAWHLICRM